MVQIGQNDITKEKCAFCGYSTYVGCLHIHHIDGNHKNNAPENLQVLCSNCHMEYHHKNPRRGKKNKRKEKDHNLETIREMELVIKHISYERDNYKRCHWNDLKKLVYYQDWIYEHVDHKTFLEIQKNIHEIEET